MMKFMSMFSSPPIKNRRKRDWPTSVDSISCNSQQYGMIPGHVWLHLKTNHNVPKEKLEEFLAARLQCLKRMKLDNARASDKAMAKQLKVTCERHISLPQQTKITYLEMHMHN
jgi:hypothetical protein